MAFAPQEITTARLRDRVADLKPKLVELVRRYGIPREPGDRIVERTLRLYVQKEPALRNDEAWATCVARASCIDYVRSNGVAVSDETSSESRAVKRQKLGLAGWVSTIGLFESLD